MYIRGCTHIPPAATTCHILSLWIYSASFVVHALFTYFYPLNLGHFTHPNIKMAPIPSHIDIDWVWSPRITYCRAHNDDTVELPMTAISGSETNSIDTSYRNHAMDTKDTEPSSRGRSKSLWCFGKRHTGWKSGLLSFATFASVVFLINLVLTIWCSSYNAGEGVLRDGDCEDIRRWNSGLHVLINIFSTILLSGSNYGMQCLSAPTRKEVDEAHKKGRRLDIGILSVRNLTRIDRKRTILWILLAISSLPLHLL